MAGCFVHARRWRREEFGIAKPISLPLTGTLKIEEGIGREGQPTTSDFHTAILSAIEDLVEQSQFHVLLVFYRASGRKLAIPALDMSILSITSQK